MIMYVMYFVCVLLASADMILRGLRHMSDASTYDVMSKNGTMIQRFYSFPELQLGLERLNVSISSIIEANDKRWIPQYEKVLVMTRDIFEIVMMAAVLVISTVRERLRNKKDKIEEQIMVDLGVRALARHGKDARLVRGQLKEADRVL
ncbi:hypothetical protein WN55_02297 [Dufourea novaeangliae]|uniref:Uncharacterized protein n=1 Tax=Dufourea novaeangliae TaxID=178035 RepID=A0A154PH43_DUFNO|nr:hypothetical protein WN55_02297 [Dufourea novaeangliae]